MNIQKLLDDYAEWLKSETSFEKKGEYYEITTPYIDSGNDYLQIYVKQEGDDIIFSDDCSTLHGLEVGGLTFSAGRKLYLERILNQYGLVRNGDELISRAPASDFAMRKHMFVQALLKIDDMLALTRQRVTSFFIEDVQDFFISKEIFYIDNVQFSGKSGFTHTYDFALQRTKTKPERLCQTLNSPDKSSTGNIIFAWNDTKSVRKSDSQLIVILNDQNGISKGVEEAFISYDAKVIKWSEREKESNLELISAS